MCALITSWRATAQEPRASQRQIPRFEDDPVPGKSQGPATQVKLTTASPVASTHNIPGATNFNGSTSAVLSQTVNKDGTTTVLASSSDPSIVGRSVTFTATVSVTAPGSGIPTGTVTFRDKNTTLGTITLSSGRAVFTTSTLSQGGHQITASYGGDASDSASTSPTLVQNVNKK